MPRCHPETLIPVAGFPCDGREYNKHDKRYIDVRAFYPDRAQPDVWLPGKGLSIPEDAAIGKARAESGTTHK